MLHSSHRPYPRGARVAHLLREEIAAVLPRLHGMSSGLSPLPPSITMVDLPTDMRSATVYFSLMDGPDRADMIRAVLQDHAGEIRQLLGRRLALRRIPPLHFVYDARFDRGAEMAELLAHLPPAPEDLP
ncbi:ribosome-binding factor A [Acidithiobacillus ferrooxidans]|uniref:ribosome-binding factor A n=1 Tax=Acidithiobacillus ferrooxidans TaxID=920 RepID=UPI0013D32B0E|nr:ribosome-binding factor A [Acidithiobacillus ferrooxidans]MBU2855532.1 ribosome-binding factor A [Acidithiobacillus ferrooxidans]MBU2858914.1 ribosome-binding factor A [Acidithiobacillus ferrooxidans]MCL4526815.1 ribosome-binding factor A [Gammaproteobacteria bacterium]MCR2829584.1 ribosome-binding factor A [Acidithiobacillus ferrooxidans]